MKKLLLLAALTLLAVRPDRAAAQSREYVVVVNPANPIAALTPLQLANIYQGKLQGWSINGQVEPISAIDLSADSPLRVTFSQRVLRRSVDAMKSYWRQELYAGRAVPPPEVSEEEALEAVRSQRGSIAYVSSRADLKGVKVLAIR